MARENLPAEITSFVRGIITEASPLTFPDNASLDEVNMVLNRDGSRRRRLGFDVEKDGSEITTTYVHDSSSELVTSSFKWENAGGFPEKSLLVIQIGNEIYFFNLDSTPISSGFISSYKFPAASSKTPYSFASVDGILVVASGIKEIKTFEYDGDSTITSNDVILKIRDFFGVEDIDSDGDNLREDSNIQKRPSILTDAHLYNLRNQTFSTPRYYQNTEALADPVQIFYNLSGTTNPPRPQGYPSNGDNLNSVLYADPNDAGNRTVERFWPKDLITNPLGNYPAPNGFFIIDALERGNSRLSEEAKLRQMNPQLSLSVTSLPEDKTPGGASSVAQYAGRIFYSGFSGSVINGDSHSPRMSSYILFSQVVKSLSDLGVCYQKGDPTSKDLPDLIDTDGGFIRIDGAYDIQALINSNDSLLVFAKNGVWRISGGTEAAFTANNYIVDKITNHGSQGSGSIVKIDNGIMYWGDDGIYVIQRDQYGVWSSQNISQNTIQTLYNNISPIAKKSCKGIYDQSELRVKWVYHNSVNDVTETHELIFDLSLGAFYQNVINNIPSSNIPKVVNIFPTNPTITVSNKFNVVVGGDKVVVNSDDVVSTIGVPQTTSAETGYLVITQIVPVVKFKFGFYNDTSWVDWKSVDGVGVDAHAYMLTGYISGGDFQRHKNISYMTVYCKRSEISFEQEGEDIKSMPESSCLVQVQFDWTNSVNALRWGREFQAYRHRRHYIPPQGDLIFDDGYPVVVTKNKIRGKGRVMSIKFSTEPGKDFNLYGWSMVIGVNGNV